MYIFDIDEASADFMTFDEISFGVDPFGITCCYPADRLWVAEGGKKDDYKTEFLDKGDLNIGDINLLVDLVDGGSFEYNETTDLVIIGQMGFYSRSRSGILVLNLAEAGVSGAEPVDYWISDIQSPRGIGTDGTYIYVTTEEEDDGKWKPQVIVLDPSSLVPLTDNTAALQLDKEDDGLLVATIDLNDRRDPQEVLLTEDYVLVTTGWNEDNFVIVADRNDFSFVKEIATGDEPFPMALYAPGGVEKYVYIGTQISNTLQILDLDTLTIVKTFSGP
jgi:DNA-binding beta-propeller fold protein YncE